MFCEHCGAQLEEGAVFCQNCGAKVEAEETQTLKQAVPSPGKQAPKRKKTGVWKWILAAAGIVVVALAGFLLLGGEEDYISLVQNGYLGEYTDATVQEILETYFKTDGMTVDWTGTELDGVPCVGFHAYPEGENLNDGTTILFRLCGKKVFQVADMGGNGYDDLEATDIAYWLNFYYMNWYVISQAGVGSTGEARLPVLQELVQNKLDKVSGTAVLYGAPADYSGDRSELYKVAGDSALIDLSAAELIDSHTNNMLSDSLAELETDSAADDNSGSETTVGDYPAAEETMEAAETVGTEEEAVEMEENPVTLEEESGTEINAEEEAAAGAETEAEEEEVYIYGSYFADNGVDATLNADVGVYSDNGRDYISLTAMSYGDRYLAEFTGTLNNIGGNVYRSMDDSGLAVIRVEFFEDGMQVTLEQMETEDFYDFRYLEGYYQKTGELNFDEVG
nr:zinc ribbon domain-containing protein [uncultured Anaerostipes sp.]